MPDLMQTEPEDSRSKWSRDGARLNGVADPTYTWRSFRGSGQTLVSLHECRRVAPTQANIWSRLSRGRFDHDPTALGSDGRHEPECGGRASFSRRKSNVLLTKHMKSMRKLLDCVHRSRTF